MRRSSRTLVAGLLQRLPCSSLVLGPPKGYYDSADEYLRAGGAAAGAARYERLLASELVTVPPPRRVFGSGDEIFSGPLTFRTEEPFLLTLPSARYYANPHAIITGDDRLLADVSAWFGDHPSQHWIFHKWKLAPARRLAGRTLFLSAGSSYFHLLLDSLPVLHLLALAGQSLEDFDHIILEPARWPFEEVLLDRFQIPRHKLVDPKRNPHLLCERLTVPPPGWHHGKWRVEFLERTLGPHGVPPRTRGKRLYVTRRLAKARRVENEPALAEALERHGFTTVATEELPFYEQVGLFQHADVVVATEGAALTNLCFCRPGTRVLMLMSDTFRYGHAAMRLWDLICAYRGLEFSLLFARTSGSGRSNVYDLSVDVRGFDAALETLVA